MERFRRNTIKLVFITSISFHINFIFTVNVVNNRLMVLSFNTNTRAVNIQYKYIPGQVFLRRTFIKKCIKPQEMTK